VPIHREILTQSHPQNNRLLFCLSAKTNTHNAQEPIKAPVHISPHQHESTSEPQRPVLASPKHRKIQKQTKTYPLQPKNQQQKMALTSWTEYHESLLMNEPWVEKLKKQSKATLEFVNNPEGLMTTVAEAAKMEEGDEDDLERIILLIPCKSKMIRVIHSCFVADGKIWGIHGTHVTSPIGVDIGVVCSLPCIIFFHKMQLTNACICPTLLMHATNVCPLDQHISSVYHASTTVKSNLSPFYASISLQQIVT
jgi:hypothetical protein